MVKILPLFKKNVIYITDYHGLESYQQLETHIQSMGECLSEDIVILDLDADRRIVSEELKKYDVPCVIGLSSLWTTEKVITALKYNCRAFLETEKIFSICNTITLILKYKLNVFDKSVMLVISSILAI